MRHVADTDQTIFRSVAVNINGENTNSLRYTNDRVVLSGSVEGLQTTTESYPLGNEKMGVNINVSRAKYMVFNS